MDFEALSYCDYGNLGGRPNVIVDGSPTDGTVITLSHWPGVDAPAHLARDLSAEMAFAYLDDPESWIDAEYVSNNHLDSDGLAGVYALTAPDHALAHRDLLIEIARAGDFEHSDDRTARRLQAAIASRSEAGDGYPELLDALPGWLDDPDSVRTHWERDEEALTADLDRVERGELEIDEYPDVGLSVVETDRFIDPRALYPCIDGFTVLELAGRRARIVDRYEGWVKVVSRTVRRRRDLRPLAERLSAIDDVEWRATGPDDLHPMAEPDDETSLDRNVLTREIVEYLGEAPVAFDPFS